MSHFGVGLFCCCVFACLLVSVCLFSVSVVRLVFTKQEGKCFSSQEWRPTSLLYLLLYLCLQLWLLRVTVYNHVANRSWEKRFENIFWCSLLLDTNRGNRRNLGFYVLVCSLVSAPLVLRLQDGLNVF